MNMSYCRFQNTLKDLRDCYNHLHDKDMSDEEWKARQEIVELSKMIWEECDQGEDDSED